MHTATRCERERVPPRATAARALATLLALLPVEALAAPLQHHAAATVKPGRWKAGTEPAGWQIVDSPTSNYQVQAQISEDSARALARHLDAMLGFYQQFVPRPRDLPDRLVVKVFARREDFDDYAKSDVRKAVAAGWDAWFDPDSGDVVACDTGLILGEPTMSPGIRLDPDRAIGLSHAEAVRLRQLFEEIAGAWTEDTAALLARECWRQYLAVATPSDVPAPPWLEAGLGECFAAVLPQTSALGRRTWRLGALNAECLRTVRRATRDRTIDSLPDLLALPQDEFDDPTFRGLHQAQAWAAVQFLLDHPELRLRQIPRAVLADWIRNKDAAAAVRRAFADLDLDSLQRALSGWIDDNPVADPLADLAREFGGKIRPSDLLTRPLWRSVYHWHLTHPPAPAPAAVAPDGSR